MTAMAMMHGLHGLHGLQGSAGNGNLSAAALAGLQASAEAIIHSAGVAALPSTGVHNLTRGAAANMKRWSPDIRALILHNTFMRHLDWATDDDVTLFEVKWDDTAIWSVKPPSDATIAPQCDLVRYYADQRADRANEILSQLGSFSPYFAIILGLTEGRNPMTLELLDAVQTIAGHATMVPKHFLACRRPAEFDARVMPFIATPGHGSFPSGHATQVFAMARVLEALVAVAPDHFGDKATRIDLVYRQAHRMAVNRTVAGLHYPMDGQAGARLGLQIGRAFCAMMGAGGTLRGAARFDPNTTPGADFLYPDVAPLRQQSGTAIPVTQNPILNWLWEQATAEFALNTPAVV